MTQVAKIYGGSLYDLAQSEQLEDRLLEELEVVCGLFDQQEDYLRLLSTPSIPKGERCGLIQEALGSQVHPYLINFLKILCENGTLGQLKDCAREFHRRYNLDRGILEAKAVTALALTPDQQKALTKKLESITGKTVYLDCRVELGVLGGIRLEMDGVQLDGTVERRLADLKASIRQAVL